MGSKKRIDFIDLAKGFCMLLVIYTHVANFHELHSQADNVIATFREPLFFLLSGLFFKRYSGFADFAIRKTNKLLVPFTFFFLTFSVALPNLLRLVGYEVRNADNLGWLNGLLVIFRPTVRSFSNAPLWFLLCLFFVNLYFFFINLAAEHCKTQNKYLHAALQLATCLGIGGLGIVLSHNGIFLPLYADTALVALPFFCIGFLIRQHTDLLSSEQPKLLLWLAAVAHGAYVCIFSVDASYMAFEFGNGFLVYSCGLCGALMVLFLSKSLNRLPIVSYLGRHSLIVLVSHMPIIQAVSIVVRKLGLDEAAAAAIVLVLTVAVELAVIPLALRLLPHATGQKDLFPSS